MLFNFAHGDIFMVGAYIGFGVSSALIALTATGAFALPSWLILVLTILFSMFLTSFVGVIVERVLLRPMIGEPHFAVLMLTIGLGFVLRAVAGAIWGTLFVFIVIPVTLATLTM